MTSVRRFTCDDLFRFNSVNLDHLTENFHLGFYLQYLAQWPDIFSLSQSIDGQVMGYVMGKVEGYGENWHGHVTAISVGPEYRRLGLAAKMMEWLEDVSSDIHNGYFVDLFVRVTNRVAVEMYRKIGYSVYRQVIGYYSGSEDAYDMRKALPRDVEKKSVIPLGRPVYPDEVD